LLSIIIPLYNEEARLMDCFSEITQFISENKNTEIIFVDDGSTDRSKEIIKKFTDTNAHFAKLISYKDNQGKGYAVKQGMIHSKGSYKLFSDLDLSTPLSEIKKLIDLYNKTQTKPCIIIGSRVHADSKVVKQSWARNSMGKVFNFIMKKIVNLPYLDTQCGFKLFDKKSSDIIFKKLKTKGFSFDVEIILLAMKNNISVHEIGVEWVNKDKSKVNMLYHPFKMILELILIKFRTR